MSKFMLLLRKIFTLVKRLCNKSSIKVDVDDCDNADLHIHVTTINGGKIVDDSNKCNKEETL